ncbi:MAG TPA: lysophospholipid acyltransferase family protein [Cyclobacteriaceae bacterium]|jgi:1-acyl-sn-glycerol-3-phosphate acyltransferase|nr:lysophospholipid acyltransferase family protein [Cyclobacteriaceae bacterium]
MKIVSPFFHGLYIFWVFLVFTFFMLLFLPGLTLPFLFGNRFSWIGYAFLWIWSMIFSWLTFIRYEFRGRENFRKGQSYIYVSNHTSFLDLPGIRLLIPGEFRPLAKKELLKIPVFGLIARGATVIVDRTDRESKHKSLDRLKQILTNGISILLFAEGTQNRTKEALQPFKDGAFRLAIDTQMPLLPMVVIGAGKLMPPGTIRMRPGLIRIVVAPEIPTAGLSDVAELKQKTFEVMKTMITENQKS